MIFATYVIIYFHYFEVKIKSSSTKKNSISFGVSMICRQRTIHVTHPIHNNMERQNKGNMLLKPSVLPCLRIKVT